MKFGKCSEMNFFTWMEINMPNNRKQKLIDLFNHALAEVPPQTELHQFLMSSKQQVLNNQFKGLESIAFTDRVSKIVRRSQCGVPNSVTKLLAKVNRRNVWQQFALGLRFM